MVMVYGGYATATKRRYNTTVVIVSGGKPFSGNNIAFFSHNDGHRFACNWVFFPIYEVIEF